MKLTTKILAFVFGVALYGAAGLVLANAENSSETSAKATIAAT